MSDAAVAAPAPLARRPGFELGPALSRGMVAAYLSTVVIVPLAAVTWKSGEDSVAGFWDTVASRQAISALVVTLVASLVVVAINVVMGTLLAWVLVRDEFPGIVNALVDLPFALPTIVAGLTLLALYARRGRSASTWPSPAPASRWRCSS